MAVNGRRAGHGDAKVFRDADGRWYAFLELDQTFDGKRRRKKVSGQSRAHVLTKRNDVHAELAKGIPPANEQVAVSQVVHAWLTDSEELVSSTMPGS